MKKIASTILVCCIAVTAFGQDAGLFLCKFTPTKSGADIVFSKNKNAFKLSIPGKKVTISTINGKSDPSNHFFNVDGIALQLAMVPLPESVPKSWHLNSLTQEQQRSILTGYVDYELHYLKNELKVSYTSLTLRETTTNGKVFTAWMFDQPKAKNIANPVYGQLYVAVICYDQVLNINTPLFDKPGYHDKASTLAVAITNTLKLYKLP